MNLSPKVDVAYDQFQNKRYFSSLDGLRFLSILGVIWHHTVSNKGYLKQYNFFSDGHLGVQLFFAISGFLITTLLLRENIKHKDISLKKFYMRRTLRIFPLYYAVLLIYIGVVYFLEKDSSRSLAFWNNLIPYFTYTSNWFVRLDPVKGTVFFFAWSLATEEQFYLIWPSVEKYFRKLWWTIPSIIFCLKILINNKIFLNNTFIGLVVQKIPETIIFGVMYAHYLFDRRYFSIIYKLIGYKWSSLLIFLLLLLSVIFNLHSVIIYFLMATFIISCVLREDHYLSSFFKIKVFVKMGVVSYGMYLYHMLCANAVWRVINYLNISHISLHFILTLLVTFGVSIISFKTFEKYFLDLKEKYAV